MWTSHRSKNKQRTFEMETNRYRKEFLHKTQPVKSIVRVPLSIIILATQINKNVCFDQIIHIQDYFVL